MSTTTATERAKYERIWREPAYHRRSPGLAVAPVALVWLSELRCGSVTDYGSGGGQAWRYFTDAGVMSWGTDLVDLRSVPAAAFCCAPLWALPDTLPRTDFAFSADVLEHLPPDRVDDAISEMRRKTRVGGFLQIATRPDNCGKLIGETLHLTVQPSEWWHERVGRHFEVPQMEDRTGEVRLWLRV